MGLCSTVEQTLDTDVCIVGSGAAGSILAETLAKAGKQVVVLEQGPRYGLDARAHLGEVRRDQLLNELAVDFNEGWPSNFNNGEIHAPAEAYSTGWVAGAGGTTLHWNGYTPRPLEDDLRVRTKFGVGRDFPIGYHELEPWLLRAEHALGVAGDADNPYAAPRSGPFPMPGHKPSPFEVECYLPAVERLGWVGHSAPWAINSRDYDGRVACQRCRYCTACPSGARYSSDRSHLARFVAMPNATLLTETKVLRLETAKDGRAIVAAHAVRRDDQRVVVRAKNFVLAMGAVETPRMLFLSGEHASDRDGLGNAGGQLGLGFSDHLLLACTIQLKRSAAHTYGYPTRVTDFHRARSDRRDHGSFFINVWPGGSAEGSDSMGLYLGRVRTGDGVSLSNLRARLSRGVVAFGFLERDGEGRLTIDEGRVDAWKSPQPNVTMSLTDRERRGLDAMTAAFKALGDAMGAEAAECMWTATKDVWHASHPSGGSAMGTSPANGVCDANCRVFGKQNLYLASSAIFPHQSANNPTLEIAAFTLRLADALKRA